VRPTGNPYNRETRLSEEQLGLVRRLAAGHASFFVVDEGPGLSGSSFLSAAEVLREAGVPPPRICLICSHQPDFDSLCADDAPNRARRFRWVAVDNKPRHPAESELFIGGGQWRAHMFPEERAWPESWVSFERLKYLSAAESPERRFYKFAGLGQYGESVFERERLVTDAAFGPTPRVESLGFVSYPFLFGRPMHPGDLSLPVLMRLAEYCAFRARAFQCDRENPDALEQMAEHNLGQLGCKGLVPLKVEHPVVADGRMQPHEWVATTGGRLLKTDSGSHGDDHFFPGVTDIAWDLAGAIVEWRMNAAQRKMLLGTYRRLTGDDSRHRIVDFITAYTAFRCAYCLMAANAMQGSVEQPRLEQAAAEYRDALSTRLGPRVPRSLVMPAG